MIDQNAKLKNYFLYLINMFLYKRFKDKCLKKSDIKEYKISSFKEGECLICLDIFQKDEIVTIINCNHIYHTQCLYTWFEKKKTCPICDKILTIN